MYPQHFPHDGCGVRIRGLHRCISNFFHRICLHNVIHTAAAISMLLQQLSTVFLLLFSQPRKVADYATEGLGLRDKLTKNRGGCGRTCGTWAGKLFNKLQQLRVKGSGFSLQTKCLSAKKHITLCCERQAFEQVIVSALSHYKRSLCTVKNSVAEGFAT